ncbi:MAG: beta-ketoacyl synthase N-terminal-like domain-containing protein [Candidatus Omnitrophica bacterium]|nr:beta-ketoacyl synthase N-terminal-like domain-containing protein [Candidatus Omnitrophota bacterium]
MPKIKAVITNYDLITAYGRGIQPLWEGILSGKSRIDKLERFLTHSFLCHNAAIILELSLLKQDSLLMQMLKMILTKDLNIIPRDAFLILATTVGEIDLLEKAVLKKTNNPEESKLTNLLKKVKTLAKIKEEGMLISCACASSSTAIAEAAGIIESGKGDCVLVVAADAVSEFVFSGFSSLMALDKDRAKPFDKNRGGLSLGEAAGFILLMSQARAKKEKRQALAQVAGWGLSCDALHMTGPARNGEGLTRAIACALKKADTALGQIGCISSHGTGTLYNDAMELTAFKNIFKNHTTAVYSIKGGLGHTLGSAGLIETILALKVQQEKIIPGTVGLKDIDAPAAGWVNSLPKKLKQPTIMLNNCGFGGINAALILKSLN